MTPRVIHRYCLTTAREVKAKGCKFDVKSPSACDDGAVVLRGFVGGRCAQTGTGCCKRTVPMMTALNMACMRIGRSSEPLFS